MTYYYRDVLTNFLRFPKTFCQEGYEYRGYGIKEIKAFFTPCPIGGFLYLALAEVDYLSWSNMGLTLRILKCNTGVLAGISVGINPVEDILPQA